MRMRSTVRPSSCIVPSSCARPALIALAKVCHGVRGSPVSGGAQRVRRHEPERWPSLVASRARPGRRRRARLPFRSSRRARADRCLRSRWDSFRRTRYLCGGVWSIQISFGPCVTVHAGSVEVDVSSHFCAGSIPAGGASAACARLQESRASVFQGVLTKSAAAAAPTTAAKASAARPGRLRIRRRSLVPRPCRPSIARVSRAEARRRASSLGAATPRRKSRKRSSSSMQISSCCRERECVRLRRELASCDLARPVKPCAHRPDRDVERERDLLVAEVGERVEEQRIALPAGASPREPVPAEHPRCGRPGRPPRPRSRPTGRLRYERRRAADGARPASGGGAGSSRSRTATAGRCLSHGSSRAARTRARTSPLPARRRDLVRRVDGDTCERRRNADRRSARTPSARSASAPRNPRPTERLHHPDCARSTKRSFTTGRSSRSALGACCKAARSSRRNSACRARGEMTRYDSVGSRGSR